MRACMCDIVWVGATVPGVCRLLGWGKLSWGITACVRLIRDK